MSETEIMSKLFLELSQFVPARTARELQLEAAQAEAAALVDELLVALAYVESNYDGMHKADIVSKALTKAQAFLGRE